MKSLACLALLGASLIAPQAWAGNEGSGGGDLCEERFKAIARDLNSWIDAGGAAGLQLNDGGHSIALATYTTTMKAAIANFKVTCVRPGDPGHPVVVAGQAKECRSFRESSGKSHVICDREKFYSSLPDRDNNAGQYRIAHHEFATLAGLEVPRGGDSEYWISEQITGFLSRQTVLRLAVKPKLKNNPQLGEITINVDPTDFDFALSPDRKRFAFKTVDGLILRDLVSGRNILTLGKKSEMANYPRFSPSGDTLCVYRDMYAKGSRVTCFDTSSGREKFELTGVGDIVFQNGAASFISVTSKGGAQVRSLADGHVIREYQVAGLPRSFAFQKSSTLSPDGRRLIVSIIDDSRTPKDMLVRRIYALDLASGNTVYSAVGGRPTFRADGKLLAVTVDGEEYGSRNGGTILIDSATGKQVATSLSYQSSGPHNLLFLRDGRLMEFYFGTETRILSGDKYDQEIRLPGSISGTGGPLDHMDPEQTIYLCDLSTFLNLVVFDLRTGQIVSMVETPRKNTMSYVLSQDRALSLSQSDPQTFTLSVLEIPPRP